MCVGEDLKENIHKKALFLRLRCFCSLWLIWPFPGWLWAEPGNNVLSSLKFMKNQKNHNSGGCSVPADAMKGSWDRPSGSILSFFSGSNKQKIVRGSDASRHLQPTASLSAVCRHFWTKHSSVLPERNLLKAFFLSVCIRTTSGNATVTGWVFRNGGYNACQHQHPFCEDDQPDEWVRLTG